MSNKKIKLYVTKHKCKNGAEMPVLKFGNKFVTFDEVIILAMTNKSPRELEELTGEIILAEF